MEVSRILVHCPVHSETHSQQREGRELGERENVMIAEHYIDNVRNTLHSELCCSHRWFVIRHSTCVESSQSPSHNQGVGVLCSGSSGSSVKHRHLISHDSDRVSGPSDSGSRSTSGDTGEGELRTGSIEVIKHHILRYGNTS